MNSSKVLNFYYQAISVHSLETMMVSSSVVYGCSVVPNEVKVVKHDIKNILLDINLIELFN